MTQTNRAEPGRTGPHRFIVKYGTIVYFKGLLATLCESQRTVLFGAIGPPTHTDAP